MKTHVHPLFLVFLWLAAGCASGKAVRESELPYHVALVPVQVQEEFADEKDDLALAIDETEATRAVAEALLARGFAKVSFLSWPEGADLDQFRSEDNLELRNEHWAEQARALGADLLLECTLFHGPEFSGQRNEKFWLNLPLFLLGGPFCYWVDDCTYTANAELSGDFYDLDPIFSERFELSSGRTKLSTANVSFTEVTMDFKARAGLNPASIATSFVVPAGLLARRNKRVRGNIEDAVVAQLAERFGKRVLDKSRELQRAERLVNFYFEPEGYGVEWNAAGELEVRGEVILEVDRTVSRMEAWRLRVGDESQEWLFGEPTYHEQLSEKLRGRYFRYPVRGALAVAPDARLVHIEIEDGSDDANRRTFTFTVPERG